MKEIGVRGREGEERAGWVENSVIQSWGEIIGSKAYYI